MTLNDLEPPKKKFLVNFSQFLDAAHISTLNCDEIARDKPRQPCEIFSTKRRFQQSKSRPLGSRRPAQAGVKDVYPPPIKSGQFTAIISCSVKMVADKHKHAAKLLLIITSNSDKLFIVVNVDDFE